MAVRRSTSLVTLLFPLLLLLLVSLKSAVYATPVTPDESSSYPPPPLLPSGPGAFPGAGSTGGNTSVAQQSRATIRSGIGQQTVDVDHLLRSGFTALRQRHPTAAWIGFKVRPRPADATAGTATLTGLTSGMILFVLNRRLMQMPNLPSSGDPYNWGPDDVIESGVGRKFVEQTAIRHPQDLRVDMATAFAGVRDRFPTARLLGMSVMYEFISRGRYRLAYDFQMTTGGPMMQVWIDPETGREINL